jgi:hypothetical protein
VSLKDTSASGRPCVMISWEANFPLKAGSHKKSSKARYKAPIKPQRI